MELNIFMKTFLLILQVISARAIVPDKDSTHPLLSSMFRTASRITGRSTLPLMSHRSIYSVHDAKRFYNKFLSQYGSKDSPDDKQKPEIKQSSDYTSGSMTSSLGYPSRRLRPRIRGNRPGRLQRRFMCRHCNFGRRTIIPRGSILRYPSVRTRWSHPGSVRRRQPIPIRSNSILTHNPKSTVKDIVSNEFHTGSEVSVKPVKTINADFPHSKPPVNTKHIEKKLSPSQQILNDIPTSVLQQMIASPKIDNMIMDALNKQRQNIPITGQKPTKPISIVPIGQSSDTSYTLPFLPTPHSSNSKLPIDANSQVLSNGPVKPTVRDKIIGTNIPPVIHAVNTLGKQVPPTSDVHLLEKHVPSAVGDVHAIDSHTPPVINGVDSLGMHVPPVVGKENTPNKHLHPATGILNAEVNDLPPIMGDVNSVDPHGSFVMGHVNTPNSHIPSIMGDAKTIGSNIPTGMDNVNKLGSFVPPAKVDVNTIDTHVPPFMGGVNTLGNHVSTSMDDVNTLGAHVPTAMGDVNTLGAHGPTAMGDVNILGTHVPTAVTDVNTLGAHVPTAMGDVNTQGAHVPTAMGHLNSLGSETPISHLQPMIGEINVPIHNTNTIHPTVDAIQGTKVSDIDTISQLNENILAQDLLNQNIQPMNTFHPIKETNGIVGSFDLVNPGNNNGNIINPMAIPSLNVVGDILQNGVSAQEVSVINRMPIKTATHTPSETIINHGSGVPLANNEIQMEAVLPVVDISSAEIHQATHESSAIPLDPGSKADIASIPSLTSKDVKHGPQLDTNVVAIGDDTMVDSQPTPHLGIPKIDTVIPNPVTETFNAGDGFISFTAEDIGLQQSQITPFIEIQGLNLHGQNDVVNSVIDTIPVNVVTINPPNHQPLDITNELIVPEPVMQLKQTFDPLSSFGGNSQTGIPVGHVEQSNLNQRGISMHPGDVLMGDPMPANDHLAHELTGMKQTATSEQLGVIVNDVFKSQPDVSANMGIPININNGFIGNVPSTDNTQHLENTNIKTIITPMSNQFSGDFPSSLNQHGVADMFDQQPIRTPPTQQFNGENNIGIDAHVNPTIPMLSSDDILTTGLMEKTPVRVEPVVSHQEQFGDVANGVPMNPVEAPTMTANSFADNPIQIVEIQPVTKQDIVATQDNIVAELENLQQHSGVINDKVPTIPTGSTDIVNANDGFVEIVPLGDQHNHFGNAVVRESMNDPMLNQIQSDIHSESQHEVVPNHEQVLIQNAIDHFPVEAPSPQHQLVNANMDGAGKKNFPETIASQIGKVTSGLVEEEQVHIEPTENHEDSNNFAVTTVVNATSSVDAIANQGVSTNVEVQEIPQANNPGIFTTISPMATRPDVTKDAIIDTDIVSHSSQPAAVNIDISMPEMVQHLDVQQTLLTHHDNHDANKIVDHSSVSSEQVPQQVHTDTTIHVTGIAPNGSSVTLELSDLLPTEMLANGGESFMNFFEHRTQTSNELVPHLSHNPTHIIDSGSLPSNTHLDSIQPEHVITHSNHDASSSTTTTAQTLNAAHLPEIVGTGDWVVLLSLPGSDNSHSNTSLSENDTPTHHIPIHNVQEHKPIVPSTHDPVQNGNADGNVLTLDELLMGSIGPQEMQNFDNNGVDLNKIVSSKETNNHSTNEIVGETPTHATNTHTELPANIETNVQNVVTENTSTDIPNDRKTELLKNPILQIDGRFGDLFTLLSHPSTSMNDIVSTDILQMLVNAELNPASENTAHSGHDTVAGSNTAT
ncbi:hypothetical protein ACF0H5_020036 [Mactra antiquata]